MITLSRIKTATIRFMGVDVLFEYNVPTAEEFENEFRSPEAKNLKDSEVFKMFGRTVLTDGIEGWESGIKPEEVVSLPGTYPLVSKAAMEIMQAAYLNDAEKN